MFPAQPCPVPHTACSVSGGTVSSEDEPALAYHHPKFIAYLRVHSGVVHLIGSDRCVVTYIIIVTSYRTFWALPVHRHPPPPTSDSRWSFYCLRSFAFS